MSPTSANLLQYNNRWKIYRKQTGMLILIQLGKSSRNFWSEQIYSKRLRSEMTLPHPVTLRNLLNVGNILCRFTQQWQWFITIWTPPPADQDLPICIDPPTLEETQKAIQDIKINKSSGLDHVITAEALQMEMFPGCLNREYRHDILSLSFIVLSI